MHEISLSQNYWYFLVEVAENLQESFEEDREELKSLAFNRPEYRRFKEGVLMGYEYFFGILPKFALDHGLPPYIAYLKLSLEEGKKKIHLQGTTEEQFVQACERYVLALVTELKKQQQITWKQQEDKTKNKLELESWGGAQLAYYCILQCFYNRASLPFQIPIKDFVSQEIIDSEDQPPYLDL